MNPFPSPVIRSARLDLREYASADAPLVSALVAAGATEALPPGAPADPGQAAQWIDGGLRQLKREGAGIHLMMYERAAARIVGSIGMFHADWEVRSVELGYGVHKDERGKGYATEALRAVARWALAEGGFQRAWLTAAAGNLASLAVARKAGLHREGTLRRAGLEDGVLCDLAVFSLLADDS